MVSSNRLNAPTIGTFISPIVSVLCKKHQSTICYV